MGVVLTFTGCGDQNPGSAEENGVSGQAKPGYEESVSPEDGSENKSDNKNEDGNKSENKRENEDEYDSKSEDGNGEITESEEAVDEVVNDEPKNGENKEAAPLVLGDERFDAYLPLLKDKRVAVFSNQSGLVGNKEKHVVDALIEKEVTVSLIFSPEHGFRGNAGAGELVNDETDEATGVEIVSLYGGSGDAFSDENAERFDTLVVDIQDVGLRFYTYYITMYNLMDYCAEYGKEVVIFDRPNPNGFYVDGPILKDEFRSGVGALPIPVVHGLTLGEMALMINGEGWLESGKDSCILTVIPCENYKHSDLTGLAVNPSPNLKSMRAVYLYPSTCLFENTLVSVARGTEHPFESFGSPYLEGVSGYDFEFVPVSMEGAPGPQFEGQTCYGKDLRDIPDEDIFENGIDLDYVIDAYNSIKAAAPDKSFFGKPNSDGHFWIDLLCGTDEVRLMIEDGKSSEEIKASWQKDIEFFIEQRKPYLLYEDIYQ
ncbi:MAG: DUF1343 domain-containing protein [Lachnospiraceae bacterium]|nr:DUF1343 domain-containing protein [Lachnospiraceae bacterium]